MALRYRREAFSPRGYAVTGVGLPVLANSMGGLHDGSVIGARRSTCTRCRAGGAPSSACAWVACGSADARGGGPVTAIPGGRACLKRTETAASRSRTIRMGRFFFVTVSWVGFLHADERDDVGWGAYSPVIFRHRSAMMACPAAVGWMPCQSQKSPEADWTAWLNKDWKGTKVSFLF